jgi:hypothetical protein
VGDAAITYHSESPEIVTVNDQGGLQAIGPGVARLIVTVTRQEQTLTTTMDVVVG